MSVMFTIPHPQVGVNRVVPIINPRDLVRYNRASRHYIVEAPGGQSHTFKAGADGRQAAFRMAIHSQSARLGEMVEVLIVRHPVLAARAWKAAEIVLAGGIQYPAHSGILASAAGQSSDYGDYLITLHDGLLRCDCPDYRDMQAPIINTSGQALCKHLIAFMYDRQLREEGHIFQQEA